MGQLLDEAIVFATHAHAGQVRKMANTPYITVNTAKKAMKFFRH